MIHTEKILKRELRTPTGPYIQRICCPFTGHCRKSKASRIGTICFAVASSLPCQELDHPRPAALPARWETITPMLPLAVVASADNCAPLVISMMAPQLEQYWLCSGSEHDYSPVPAHRDPEQYQDFSAQRGREPILPFNRGSPAVGFFRPVAGITKRAHLTRIAERVCQWRLLSMDTSASHAMTHW
jgi:hypothetical protein